MQIDELTAELSALREELAEAKETLAAIRNGEVDGVIVQGAAGEQLYTLQTTTEPYRVMMEEMSQGVVTLSAIGLIVYANRTFSEMVKVPLTTLIASRMVDHLPGDSRQTWLNWLERSHGARAALETPLLTSDGRSIPVEMTLNPLPDENSAAASFLIVTDLTEQRNRESALLNLMTDLCDANRRLEATQSGLRQLIEEREKTQLELEKAHARLRHFVDANMVGVLVANPSGRVLEANDYYLRMIGFTRAEFEAGLLDWRQITPPEWLDLDEKALRELAERGISTPYEKEYLRRDGTRVPVFLADVMLPGPNREIAAFALDLTEQKRATAAVRVERQRFLDVLETLPAMICLLAEDYHLTFANRAFRDRFGEYNGQPCYAYCFGKTKPCEFCEAFSVFATGQPHRWEVTTPMGDIIEAHDFPFVDTDGKRLVLEMDIDITRWRRAEREIQQLNATLEQRVLERTEELRQSEERFKAIAASTPDHVIVQDRDLRYTMVINPQLGLRAEDMLGKLDQDFLEPADAQKVTSLKRRVLDTGQPVAVTTSLVSRTGETEFFEGSYVPRRDAENKVDGLIGYFRNVTERKRAEAALHESQERVELALQVARAFAFEWKVSTDEVRRSNHCADILGITGDATRDTGKTYFARVHPEDRERFVATVKALTPERPRYSVVYRILRSDQSVATLQESAVAEFDGNGTMVRLIGMTADVTARVTAEQTVAHLNQVLKRRMAELQTIFDTVPVGLAIADDSDGKHIRGNPTIERLVGAAPGDELSLSAEHPPAYRVSLDSGCATPANLPMQRACRGETVVGELMRVVRPDGDASILYSNATPLRDDQGHPTGAVGAFMDITEVRRAEEALRQSEQRFRTIYDSAPVSIWQEDWTEVIAMLRPLESAGVTDFAAYFREHPDFVARALAAVRIRDVNQWTLTMFGASDKAQMLASLEAVFATADTLPGFMAELDALARGETTYRGEMALNKIDGDVIHGLLAIAFPPRNSESGDVLVTVIDITQNKKAEFALRELAADLQETNRDLESFSYSISHDLRAPLRSIDGFSRILLRDAARQLDGENRANLERVRAASQRMGELIDNLLELSRTGRAELRRMPVDLSALAQASLNDLRRNDPDRPIEIAVAAGVHVVADPVLIRSALDNLLGNAWKFTRQALHPRIEFGQTEHAGKPVFYVRDNGVGFDMSYAGKLFAPFQRLHSAEDFPGMGIGLATVQRIVRRHGGRIWAESAPNAGACFYFTLPDRASDKRR